MKTRNPLFCHKLMILTLIACMLPQDVAHMSGMGTANLPQQTPAVWLYLTNQLSDRVSVFDTSTNSIIDTLPIGEHPQGITSSISDGRIYTADSDSNRVSVIDVASNSIIAAIPVGSGPVIPVTSPKGDYVYVTDMLSHSISVIEAQSNSVVHTIADVIYPWGLAISPDGTRIAATEYVDGRVAVFETSSYSRLATVPVGSNPEGVIYHPGGSRIYVANLSSGTVSEIDTTTNSVFRTIPVGDGPVQFDFNADASRLYVTNNWSASVSEIDVGTGDVVRTFNVGAGPIDVEVVGQYLYVTNHDDDSISIVELTSGTTVETVYGFSGPHSIVSYEAPGTSPNLVRNPGFEIKTPAPASFPIEWQGMWEMGSCTLEQDSTQSHSGDYSIRTSCVSPSDASWVQRIPTLHNRDYVLSGWIKTEGVEHSDEWNDVGANLSIYGTWTHTTPLFGTQEWTYVSVQFNSEESDFVTIAARLGHWSGTSTGTVWFDDLRVELMNHELTHLAYLPLIASPQQLPPPYAWKLLVLIYQQTDVTYTWEGQTYHLDAVMNDADVHGSWQVINGFPGTIREWSDGWGNIVSTIVYPPQPITQLTSLGSNGYWVSPSCIESDLDTYAPAGTYDSIIVIWLATDGETNVPSAGWGWSLAPTDWSNGAGYTTVAVPGSHAWMGYYPDEIFVHEWNHQTTGFYLWLGYPMPSIDEAGKYGYAADGHDSWRVFLSDVMRGRVWDGSWYIGIKPEIWQSATPTWPVFATIHADQDLMPVP